ncbi:hopanoid-associated phosphorylase [Nitrosospira multiformis]|uniref:Hopanoid-associated phosphorylase n=1 Tax=Nitrosospira multiformis TaxID=1231 RepID=A0A1I0BTL9_9PROT|nr:phosphorylase [Nitrosospira multiformis]SET09752.1 hopanoid-associated phosphorylase [Nitrosospira multiformis]
MGIDPISCIEPEVPRVTGAGIIVAMRVEARCITPLRLFFNQRTDLGNGAAVWLCGVGAEAAGAAATGLKNAGAAALMSFGFAGALHSGLNSGALMLPESIHTGGCLLPVDLNWRTRLQRCLPDQLNVAGGILAASSKVLTSTSAKRDLAELTGANAVDMESGAVAEVATNAGLPFMAVRAISDPLDFSPPRVLLEAVRPDGSPHLGRLLGLLLKRSLTLGTLLRLASDARAARSTLSTVVRYADAEMRAVHSPEPSLGGYIAK